MPEDSDEEQATDAAPAAPRAVHSQSGTPSVFISYASSDSAVADSVCTALERASSKRHPVVSFRIDLAPVPAALEYFLNTSQWLDASATRVEQELPKLVDAVQQETDEANRILYLREVLQAAGHQAEADDSLEALIAQWVDTEAFLWPEPTRIAANKILHFNGANEPTSRRILALSISSANFCSRIWPMIPATRHSCER